MKKYYASYETIIMQMTQKGAIKPTYWNTGELPDCIDWGIIKSQTYSKIGAVRQWLLSHGHPVDDDAIRAICQWHRQKGDKMSVPALAFKYLFLCIERDNGNAWTKALDDHADLIAKKLVKEHKIR